MIVITVPRECLPPRVTITRIRGAAKNAPPRRLRCKGKRPVLSKRAK